MSVERIREIVRNFPENSFKRLLENPANVRDLLALAGAKVLDRIDFARMKPTAATFVQSDYRHVAADLVLTAPLRPSAGKRQRRWLTVYILIEHQSEPERLMPLRVVRYVVEAYQAQVRDWPPSRAEREESLLQPVLPVVFYTGDRTWDRIGTLADLIAEAGMFAEVTPLMTPLFVNVRALAPKALESKGGLFGQVLRLWSHRRAKSHEFRGLLHEVVSRLDRMPEVEQGRWLELLS